MRVLINNLIILVFVFGSTIAKSEERSFVNENIGTVLLNSPKDWKAIERHHIRFGTTFYRLVPPKKDFDVEFMVNDLKHMRMDALVDKDLELYIESNLSRYAAESVEKKATAHRFGKNKDGVYARLTDDSDQKEEFLLLTQGVRLIGDGKGVVLFILKSNDKDKKVLNKVLEIADSIRIK